MFRALMPLMPISSDLPEFNPRPALEIPAVLRCQVALERAFRSEMNRSRSRMLARKHARDAFCQALPELSSLENLANFIACVAFAISTGVFADGKGAELLYAAQIALKSLALGNRRETLRDRRASLFSRSLESNHPNKGLNRVILESKGLAARKNGKKPQKTPAFVLNSLTFNHNSDIYARD
jgi:hypothetical protein